MQSAADQNPTDAVARALSAYEAHLTRLEAAIDALPAGSMADRFALAMQDTLAWLERETGAIQALFSAAMRSDSTLDLMAGSQARQLARAWGGLVLGSDDALPAEQARQLGIALAALHNLLILFWLYDRSPNRAASRKLTRLVSELLKTLRPLYFLPMVRDGVARLADIMLPPAGSIGAAAQEDPRDRQHEDFDVHGD